MNTSTTAPATSTLLADFLDGVQLPTMPDVARELIATLHDDDIPFEKVRNAIARDPALTAKLIRLANSARFGLKRQLSSLDDGITMVGLNQERTLAMAACMSSSFAAVPGVDSQAFWKESMATAGYAQWLARTLGTNVQQSWLTGFMVRLGELIIAQKVPERIAEIERLPHFAGGRWEREHSVLGFTEGAVTAELARRWNFPEAIAHALETASDPMRCEPFCRLGGILHIATLLAELELDEHKSAADAIDALPRDVVAALQLDPEWLTAHMPDVESFIDTPI